MATDVLEIVAASRAAQGLPPKVTDPAAIARLAALLLNGQAQRPTKKEARRASDATS